MARIITISIDNIKLEAEFNDTFTADAVWSTLPYEVQGSVWGDEVYFRIPEELEIELENATDVVEIGDLGYWPVGNAFCIFYGPTPASMDERPVPASPVTIFGKVLGDATELHGVKTGVIVFVEKKE
ncbi:MAG: hypothetical protein JSU79_03455 [Dehalococcoidales bacterium]|nr:MAG: hypothetical protein JSU79_03455 [Dehalococcoidales bacterium]